MPGRYIINHDRNLCKRLPLKRRLLLSSADFSNFFTNSECPDQIGAVWSGSTLFAYILKLVSYIRQLFAAGDISIGYFQIALRVNIGLITLRVNRQSACSLLHCRTLQPIMLHDLCMQYHRLLDEFFDNIGKLVDVTNLISNIRSYLRQQKKTSHSLYNGNPSCSQLWIEACCGCLLDLFLWDIQLTIRTRTLYTFSTKLRILGQSKKYHNYPHN